MTSSRRILLALFLLAAACGLRAPFLQRTTWNLDEGMTFTAAQQIAHGAVLYRDAADHRNPLVPYLKAGIFAVAGEWNTKAVHAIVALLLGLCAVGLWQLARRLGDEPTGVAAALVFTVLCFLLPDGSDAMAAHTEWFLLLFSLAGFLAFAAAIERPGAARGVGIGVLFALAFLCKQPGLLDYAVALVLLGLLLLTRPGQRGALLRLALGTGAGLALVIGLTVAYFAAHGATRDLLYYGWTYNSVVYVPAISLHDRLLTLDTPLRLAAQHLPAALVLGLLGAITLTATAVRGLGRRPAEVRLLPWLALGWTASGLVAASLSGRSFSHYSIQVIPGLSLACGWVLAGIWSWCAAHGRLWRLAAAALLTLAIVDTGRRIGARSRALAVPDDEWSARFEVVRRHTRPDERIFTWGFTPEYYVYARRLPASRFLYTSFLTGMIPWTNLDPLVDTTGSATPGSWAQLAEDFRRTPPAMIIDTGPIRGQGKYPLRDQPWLWSFVARDYAELTTAGQLRELTFYRRLTPVLAQPLPAAARPDDSAQLEIGYTEQYPPVPTLGLQVPADTTRVDLYAGGQLFRSLELGAGECRIGFFVPETARPPGPASFRVALHRSDGIHLGPPVSLPSQAEMLRGRTTTGPALSFAGGAVQPLACMTPFGPPTARAVPAGTWNTPGTARLVYRRQNDQRTFSFTYGLDPSTYFDGAQGSASDGVDFLVDFVADDGRRTRLFTRRLEPKNCGADQGAQTATLTLPDLLPGGIVVDVLPGRHGAEHRDLAYLGPKAGSGLGSGPPLTFAAAPIQPAEVLATQAPSMVADPEGNWVAHSPSAVSYDLPPAATSLVFSYGLAPASYDGSLSGRTNGIQITATAERADNSTTEVLRRHLDPAHNAADRGRQTSRLELAGEGFRRITISIGPGPGDDFSFDWSYLADLRLESAAPAAGD